MKKILFILVVFSFLTLAGCNKDYKESTSNITLIKQTNDIKTSEEYTNNFSSGGVKSKTFEKINIINGFSKDGNYVYYLGDKIEGVDPISFTRISGTNYYKDINNMYFKTPLGTSLEIIKGIDVNTFELLKNDNTITEFAKHKNNIYYQSNIVNGADGETFIILGCWNNIGGGGLHCYAKDKNGIYFNANRMNGIQLNTFEIIKNSIYAKDENNIYYEGKIVDGADINTFKINDYGIEIDKNYIFSQGKKIEGSDSKTFTHIGASYYKDSKQVYTSGLGYKLDIVEGADLETFEVIGEDGLAKDKFNRYILGRIDN